MAPDCKHGDVRRRPFTAGHSRAAEQSRRGAPRHPVTNPPPRRPGGQAPGRAADRARSGRAPGTNAALRASWWNLRWCAKSAPSTRKARRTGHVLLSCVPAASTQAAPWKRAPSTSYLPAPPRAHAPQGNPPGCVASGQTHALMPAQARGNRRTQDLRCTMGESARSAASPAHGRWTG